MATATLVEFPLEAGRNLVEKVEKDGVVFTAAYWQFQEDEEAWLLVLASMDVPIKGPRYVVEKVRSALNSLSSEERNGLSMRNLVIVSPYLMEIESLSRQYGKVEREPLDRWTIYSRSEPYIYRLLPA